jgi:hypothetical protein
LLSGFFDDLWTVDVSMPAIVWTLLSPNGSKPAPRAGNSLVHMDGALYTFGGQCDSGSLCEIRVDFVLNY